MSSGERARFLRGLTIGALIGAVIAGSRIWRGLGGGDAGRRDQRGPVASTVSVSSTRSNSVQAQLGHVQFWNAP